MSAFALAPVVGVPVGLRLGETYGWQSPFQVLAVMGSAIFIAALFAMPALRDHLHDPSQGQQRSGALDVSPAWKFRGVLAHRSRDVRRFP